MGARAPLTLLRYADILIISQPFDSTAYIAVSAAASSAATTNATCQACMFKQAAFCLEEVLSMGVLAPLTLLRYADTLATIGGAAHLKTARAYYSKALQVRPDLDGVSAESAVEICVYCCKQCACFQMHRCLVWCLLI